LADAITFFIYFEGNSTGPKKKGRLFSLKGRLRRVVGPDYRVLMPASIFGGGAFLVICDTISRSVLAPMEIPVGVTTALLGGPFFVWLLWSR
jgi:ABC-type cobalamin transport system permease subunit